MSEALQLICDDLRRFWWCHGHVSRDEMVLALKAEDEWFPRQILYDEARHRWAREICSFQTTTLHFCEPSFGAIPVTVMAYEVKEATSCQ